MSIGTFVRPACALLLICTLAGCASIPKSGGIATVGTAPEEPAQSEGSAVDGLNTSSIAQNWDSLAEEGPPVEANAENVDAHAPLVDGIIDLPEEIEASGTSQVASVYDPWEPLNRRVHRFNVVVDRTVAHPFAKAYTAILPAAVRGKVTNFFDNLSQPVTVVNALLQGRVRHSAEALGRFLLNSTVGLGGLFDPAARFKMQEREEDFGQTMAHWGWRRSRYIELPLLGPRTVRDVFGLVSDTPLQPLTYVEEDRVRVGLQALSLVDGRARALSLDSLRTDASDDYLLIRDSWMQYRNFQIEKDSKSGTALPDYLKE